MPNSYPETSITPSNITLYMNSGSYAEAFSGNSHEQNNCFVIPSINSSHATSEQQEILANLGGLQAGDHNFTAWREGRNEMMVTHPLDGQNVQGQGLSLSLGTQIPSGIQMPPFHDRSSNLSFDSFLGRNPSISGHRSGSPRHESLRQSDILPPDLPEGNQDLNRGDYSLHGIPSNIARTSPNSKYLQAAQQLLDEVVDIQSAAKRLNVKSHSTHENSKKTSKEDDERLENERAPANGELNTQDSVSNSSCELSHAEKQDLQNKLTKLLSMLDEVDSRYKQYYHQMQIVVSSFDVIAGRGAAKPYTALALQTISRHFRCLRDAITGQISVTQKSLGEQDASGNHKGVGISRLRYVDQQIRQQRAIQQLGVMQHAWRPQRGLPESSVSILRAWLFEHFLHPYPKDSDKIMLARQTGLTRSQVSNWFINARVRLWKPMIEEMYKEETGDAEMESSSSSENASKATKSDVKTSDDRCDDLQQSQGSIANKNSYAAAAGLSNDLRSDNVLDTEIMGSAGLASLHHGGHVDDTEYGNGTTDCSPFPDDTVQSDGGTAGGFMAVTTPTCQMSELGRFETGNGVSLTLGLQHREGGGDFMSGETHHHSFVVMRGEDGIYNTAASAPTIVGAETSELECVGTGDQQRRYSSTHLLHDFVV
ncbi:BEL1-like homeodomain protein 6 [Senna tora]|uniref:BEL1-like homeodomain protein 6 n=1 Tax=Senna tora TaxID=362788 RepID=A0A835CIA3_9FABA|nr:BEL1-like homeodomain protein 6 [Senna tora]